jgi:hypothetical protein
MGKGFFDVLISILSSVFQSYLCHPTTPIGICTRALQKNPLTLLNTKKIEARLFCSQNKTSKYFFLMSSAPVKQILKSVFEIFSSSNLFLFKICKGMFVHFEILAEINRIKEVY